MQLLEILMESRWMEKLNKNSIPWLLESDPEKPSIRYFALRDLMECDPAGWEVKEARQAITSVGPVPAILAAQEHDGYWAEPGPGYYPKYRGTVWQIISLAMVGADGSDPQVKSGCEYVLDNSCSAYGGFSADGRPSGMIHCLQGNLAAALIDLGWLDDDRLSVALDWLARSITGDGIAPSKETNAQTRYYRSGNSGPGFMCAANNQLPCAWGAVKSLLALGKVPESERTPEMRQAIEVGLTFLLSRDPALADYPMGYSDKPSRSWFQPGFPIGYVTDFLQNLEVLFMLGCQEDPRLEPAIDLLLSKQDAQGRWKMEYTYNGKTWVDIEKKGQPSKWVTLRALRVIKGYFSAK
jgi:hypothetical protein